MDDFSAFIPIFDIKRYLTKLSRRYILCVNKYLNFIANFASMQTVLHFMKDLQLLKP